RSAWPKEPGPGSTGVAASAVSLQVLAVHVNAGDLHGGKWLAVSVQLLVLLLALEVEDQNLIGAALLDHLTADEGLRRLDQFALGAADGQHFIELNVFAAGLRQLLDLNHVPGCDAILLSPGADHRVHGNASNELFRPPRRGANRLKLFVRLHFPEPGRKPSRKGGVPLTGPASTGKP